MTLRLLLVVCLLGALVLAHLPGQANARGRRKGRRGSKAKAGPASVSMGPFLRDLTLTGVTVVFRTDKDAVGEVLVRNPGGKDIQLADNEPTVHHEFRIDKLERDKIYVYRIVVDGKELPGGSFRTPPNPETPVIIGVYGDTRKYQEAHQMVCESLARQSPDLLIHTGDLVHDGYKRSDWLTFFRVETPMLRDTPMYPVIGNHDDRGKMGKWWFETLFGQGSALRSITYGPVHLVILNSEAAMKPQAKWLEEDLEKARENPDITFVLAFIHHGPYGTGQFNGKRSVAKYIPSVLRKYGPSIVFSGHEHNYERGEVDGLPFYVTGGGGAVLAGQYCKGKCPEWSHIFKSEYHYLLVEASPKEMKICAYRPNGTLLEPCITRKAPKRKRKARTGEHEAGTAEMDGEPEPAAEDASDDEDDEDDESIWDDDDEDEDEDEEPGPGYHAEGGDWSKPEPKHREIPEGELPPDAPPH